MIRRTTRLTYFTLPDYSGAGVACLAGHKFGTSLGGEAEKGATSGVADVHFAPPFMTLQTYGDGCGSGACVGPRSWLVDLRTDAYSADGRLFALGQKIRATPTGEVALILRESPDTYGGTGYPPGPGPFRVDLIDRHGRRTIDSGPGIDPTSLRLRGQTASWLHDGAKRTALLAQRRPG